MIDPVQAFLEAQGIKSALFPPTSRYYAVAVHALQTPDGKTSMYLGRRFLPQPEQLSLVQEHRVVEGDRVDNLAQQYLGDPEQYWRLCDANRALAPSELTDTVGRVLRVTLPEGMSGAGQ